MSGELRPNKLVSPPQARRCGAALAVLAVGSRTGASSFVPPKAGAPIGVVTTMTLSVGDDLTPDATRWLRWYCRGSEHRERQGRREVELAYVAGGRCGRAQARAAAGRWVGHSSPRITHSSRSDPRSERAGHATASRPHQQVCQQVWTRCCTAFRHYGAMHLPSSGMIATVMRLTSPESPCHTCVDNWWIGNTKTRKH